MGIGVNEELRSFTFLVKRVAILFSIMSAHLISITAVLDFSAIEFINSQCINSSIYEKMFTTAEFRPSFFQSSQPRCAYTLTSLYRNCLMLLTAKKCQVRILD